MSREEAYTAGQKKLGNATAASWRRAQVWPTQLAGENRGDRITKSALFN
ncbi:MAG: hypothetical protein M3Y72_23265 [Acidobacteriota bacterium]|nr:hypothetical protein [Acidobacteriota bacterium]